MERKKEIDSVAVDDNCFELDNCEHDITIKYKDGTEKKKSKYTEDIVKQYAPYLDQEKALAIPCFSGYANFFKGLPAKVEAPDEGKSCSLS